MTDQKLRNYLEWLITPQDENEKVLFRLNGVVDDYIQIKNKICSLSRKQLIDEINIQLHPYGIKINEENII